MLHDHNLENGILRYTIAHGYTARRLGALDPADMSTTERGRMLWAIKSVAATGEQVTVAAVVEALNKRGVASAARDVKRLMDDSPRLGGLDEAVVMVRELAVRRRLRDPLMRMAAMSEDGDIAELRSMVRAFAHKVDADDISESGSESFNTGDMIQAALENYISQKDRTPVNLGPLRGLGREMMPGHMIIVGGRSNAGKSQLAMYIGRKWFDSTGARIGIVSVEDRAHVWGDRIIAYEAGISLMSGVRVDEPGAAEFRDDDDSDQDERVSLNQDQWDKVGRVAAQMKEANPFHLEVMDRSDIADVERAMLRCVQEQCDVIIVDYVQEIGDKSAHKNASQHERYSGIAARIKMVAKRSKTRLILCSQVSRPQRGSNAEPTMTDLKGSGDIENMSEAIVLLWKEHEDSIHTMAKVVKLKNGSDRPRVVLKRNTGGMIESVVRAKVESRDGLDDVPGQRRRR